MAIEVLMYHSGMAGMPSATLNTPGALIALLDFVLVTGSTPVSVTGVTRVGAVATYTTAAVHSFQIHDVVENAGWDQAEYNVRVRITARTGTTYTGTIVGAPVTPGTGTGTVKYPSAGWTKESLGANIAAYRTIMPGSLGHYMQVEDNSPGAVATVARVRIAKELATLDVASQLSEATTIRKSMGSGAPTYTVIADGKTCYIFMGNASDIGTWFFGEIKSYVPGDSYHYFTSRGSTINGSVSMFSGFSYFAGTHFPAVGCDTSRTNNFMGARFLRGFSQIGADINASPVHLAITLTDANPSIGSTQQSLVIPSAADGSVPCSPIPILDNSATPCLRGILRGVYVPIGRLDTSGFVNFQTRLNEITFNGAVRRLIIIRYGPNIVTPSACAQIAFDLTDSWDV